MQITTVLRDLDDQRLNRYTRALALILVAGTIAFVAFYVFDRWRPASAPIVDQQIVALEQKVRDSPNDIAVRGQLADTYLAKGRSDEALAQYDVIIATGSSLKPAQFGRAQALVALGRLDEAANAYQAVIDIAITGEMANVDPVLEASYYGLGSIAMKQGRPADAIVPLEKALAINRSDADAAYLLGTAFIGVGELDKATTVLRASVVFVPYGWREPYTALADAYKQSGRTALAAWAAAMADLNDGRPEVAEPALRALVDGEAAVDAAVGLGLLYETRGDNAAAVDWYARALAIQPDSNTAQLGLSRVGPLSTPGAATSPAPTGGTN